MSQRDVAELCHSWAVSNSETVTTPEFSATVRWARESVLGVSLDELARHLHDDQPAPGLRELADQLAAVEAAYRAVTDRDLANYDTALYYASAGSLHGFIAALVVAHFGAETLPHDAATRLSEAQQDESAYPLVLGVDLSCRYFSLIRSGSCTPLPAAAPHLTERHKTLFGIEAAEIAQRRRGLVLVPYGQRKKPGICDLTARGQDNGTRREVGVPDVATSDAAGVDPLDPIRTLEQAWRVAAAMNAAGDEVSALAWGLLLTRASAAPEGGPMILHWAALDAAGPAGYESAIAAALPNDSNRALIPAADHIWSVTRRYLSQWHGQFVRTCARVETSNSSGLQVTWMRPQLRTDPEGLRDQRIVFGDTQLPGLPEVLACATPALYIDDTSIALFADTSSRHQCHWLPAGVNKRMLYRELGDGRWLPIQTRPL